MHNMKNLEKRMYFLVVSSLHGISKGIMCGHAALEYAHKYGNDEGYVDFIENWKTWIILNGGTTNSSRDFDGVAMGSLDQYADQLNENNIKFSYFKEPDLNNALTAICLVVDERVFNREDYPDFFEWQIKESKNGKIFEIDSKEIKERYINEIGINDDILFLKELLNTKKLA